MPEDLLGHECIRIRHSSGSIMRWEVSRSGQSSFVDVLGRLVVGTSALALRAAAAGIGIAFVERRRAEEYLLSGQVTQLMEEWTPPFEGVALYYPRLRIQSAAFRAFVEHFRTHVS